MYLISYECFSYSEGKKVDNKQIKYVFNDLQKALEFCLNLERCNNNEGKDFKYQYKNIKIEEIIILDQND